MDAQKKSDAHKKLYCFLSLLSIVFFTGFPGLEIHSAIAQVWKFTDVTDSVNLKAQGSPTTYMHGYGSVSNFVPDGQRQVIAGGVASGDYDADGWVDLYIVSGDVRPNLLFRNKGDGTFEEVGVRAGVALAGKKGSGPVFADVDGDGWLDLFVGGVGSTRSSLFRNLGDGTFKDVSTESGLDHLRESFSAAFGDYDRDGDLDVFITHWIQNPNKDFLGREIGYLFQNSGLGLVDNGEVNLFKDVSVSAGITGHQLKDFTPNFADINNDGWPDLLIAADFLNDQFSTETGGSRVFLNNQDGTFSNVTDQNVITDENGMGASIFDFDHDGDLDWFVTSIHDPNGIAEGNWGVTGNRLYQNQGDGSFLDVTTVTGVREGFWGWGSCAGDFDNDGHPDLYHVNGFRFPPVPVSDADLAAEFHDDPAVFFLSKGDGTFTEQGSALGLADTGQGRGLVCFDYDRDGDLDIFIANNQSTPKFYRNDLEKTAHYIDIKLKGNAPNIEGIGARIRVTTGSKTQMQELRAGSNFESQDPALAHFGLGNSDVVDVLEVTWPDGETKSLQNISADQYLTIGRETAVLTWPPGQKSGVNSDMPAPGDTVTFKVRYIDPGNNKPIQSELWIDQNDDGVFSEGVGKILVYVSPGGGTNRSMPGLMLAGLLGLVMILLSLWTDSCVQWGRLSSVIFLLVLAGGCGGGGAGNSTTAQKTERFVMMETDSADQDTRDGKDYQFSLKLEAAGDNQLSYQFVFKNSAGSAVGIPSENQTLTLN